MSIRKRSPHAREIDECLELAATWLGRTYLPGVHAWPARPNLPTPSVWGGTTDALRALIALADHRRPRPAYLPDIDLDQVAAWLRKRQDKSGAFASIGTPYAGAESTALVLIGLYEHTRGRGDPAIARALAFLDTCVDDAGGVATTPKDSTEPRVLPTALTLRAFALWQHDEPRRREMINYLFSCQDGTTWGWGVNSRARPNAATTAQVITALRTADYPESRYAHAIDFLIDQQLSDGSWINSLDEWVATPSNSVNYCLMDGTAWALTALNGIDGPRARAACAAAAKRIVETQAKPGEDSGGLNDAGSWLHDTYSTNRYVWLAAQNVLALHAWASSLPSVSRAQAATAGFRLWQWFQRHAQGIILASLVLYVGAPKAFELIEPLVDGFAIDWTAVRNGLVTASLWTGISGVALWIWRSISGRRRP